MDKSTWHYVSGYVYRDILICAGCFLAGFLAAKYFF